MADTIVKDLGASSAYAYAVEHGYTGTEKEFAEEQANFAKNAQQVATDRKAVETAAEKILQDAANALDAIDGRKTEIAQAGEEQKNAVKTAGAAQVSGVQAAGTAQKQIVEQAGAGEVEEIHTVANDRLAEFDAVGAVRFDRQELDTAQKAQARGNTDAGDAIVCSASGDVVTVADASDQPLRGLRVFGRSTQDGTPTPDAPVPIVSVGDDGGIDVHVCGRNLVDMQGMTNRKKVPLDVTENGAIWPAGNNFYCMLPCYIGAGMTVRIRLDSGNDAGERIGNWVLCYAPGGEPTDVSNTTIVSLPLTASKPAYWIYLYKDNVATQLAQDLLIRDVQVSVEAADYEPYKPAQSLPTSTPNGLPGIPVSSGGNYTDADGQQWICDEVDFGRGVYVQRTGTVDCGELSWEYNASENRFVGSVPNCQQSLTRNTNFLSEAFGRSSKPENQSAVVAFEYKGSLYLYNTGITEAGSVPSLISGRKLTYILATPVETPLSETDLTAYRSLHSNKPNTTVYIDEGAHIELTYAADTKTYIDNKFRELATAMVANA